MLKIPEEENNHMVICSAFSIVKTGLNILHIMKAVENVTNMSEMQNS